MLSLFGTFFFFAAGMALAVLAVAWKELPPRVPGFMQRADLWITTAAALWLVSTLRFDPVQELWILPAAFLLVGACVLPLRAGVLSRALDQRALAVVGVVSYSLYLWHYPILGWLRDLPGGTSTFTLALMGVPAALAAAALSYALVERPFLRLRRRWA